MNRIQAIAIRSILALSIGFASITGHAQLSINLTQSDYNGINLADLEQTLNETSETAISLHHDIANVFDSNYDLIGLNAAEADLACENNQLLKLRSTAQYKPYLARKKLPVKNQG